MKIFIGGMYYLVRWKHQIVTLQEMRISDRDRKTVKKGEPETVSHLIKGQGATICTILRQGQADETPTVWGTGRGVVHPGDSYCRGEGRARSLMSIFRKDGIPEELKHTIREEYNKQFPKYQIDENFSRADQDYTGFISKVKTEIYRAQLGICRLQKLLFDPSFKG